jgi:hypothetical protein
MAILRAEGFHHFNGYSDWLAKGHNGGGGNSSVLPTGGRDGRGCLSLGLNNSAHCVTPRAVTTLYTHIAFNVGARTGQQTLFDFRNGTNSHVALYGSEDGSITIYQTNPPFNTGLFLPFGLTALGQTPPQTYRANVWHHLQMKLKIGTSDGAVQMKMDGIEIFNQTGLYTFGNNGFANITQLGMGGGPTAPQLFSDLLLVDERTTDDFGNTSTWTGLVGDAAIFEFINPIDGDLLQWLTSGGPGSFADFVNQNPQDGDTTYLTDPSPAGGRAMSFSFPNSITATSVLAVKNTVCHRKDAAGFATIRLLSRSVDDVNHFSPTMSTTESYKFDEIIADVDPKDGAAWSSAPVTRVTDTQLGFEHNA